MLSFVEIADRMDPVEKPRSLARLLNLHRFLPGEERTFRSIVVRHEAMPDPIRLLCQNTFLMHIDLPIIDTSESVKPAVAERAPEIGSLIDANFDVAALCEVWEPPARDGILSTVTSVRSVSEHFGVKLGPLSEQSLQASGLVTLNRRFGLVYDDFHEFDADFDGDFLNDENLAGKGILLSVFDLGDGLGKLEVFSTHATAVAGEPEEQDGRRGTVRDFQMAELLQYVQERHDPRNHALVVGDFNIDASSDEFHRLNRRLDRLGFEDAWAKRNHFVDGSDRGTPTPGYTSDVHMPDTLAAVCQPAADNPLFCDDFMVPRTPTDFPMDVFRSMRIDHVFVTKANAESTYNLDYSRPRRVNMRRDPSATRFAEIAVMSDHLGIAVNLIASPK